MALVAVRVADRAHPRGARVEPDGRCLLAAQVRIDEASALAAEVVRRCEGREFPERPLLVITARHCQALYHLKRREFTRAEAGWKEVRDLQGVKSPLLPRTLNLLTLGDDVAASRGVDVGRAQRIAFLSASLATGAAISMAGPIGFIGIIIPHLVRLIVGPDHRLVLPAATLFGAAFLVGCDLVARTILAPVELPVGIITAMIGGPFFLWLLIRKR